MMGEVTEQEAREALRASDSLLEKLDNGEPTTHDELSSGIGAPHVIFGWARQELARRDAERMDREKPIDAEWLDSIGATWFNDYLGFDLPYSARLEVVRDYGVMTVECGMRPKYSGGWVQIGQIANRGDVLDLLAVLKGGSK